MLNYFNNRDITAIGGVILEAKKRFLINIMYFALILIIGFIALKYLLPLLFPFILGFIIAAMLQKPIAFVSRKTGMSQKLSAIVIILVILIVISVVLFLIGNTVANNIESFIALISKKIENLPSIIENLKHSILRLTENLPSGLKNKITEYINNIFELFTSSDSSIINAPINGFFGAAKKIPSIFLAVIVSIIATAFLSIDYRKIVNFILRQLSPKNQNTVIAIKRIFFSTILKLLKSYFILMLITFAEIAATLYLMKIMGIYNTDYVILISALIAIIDIVPIIGTGTIFIPWAIYSMIMDNITMGVVLVIGYLIITIVRNILEPKIIGDQVGASPVITLVFMYIGLKLFGVVGLIVLPMLVIVVKVLSDTGKIRIWKNS